MAAGGAGAGLASRAADLVEAIEDQIFEKNAAIVDDMAAFADLDLAEESPDREGPPRAWVKRYGKDRAWRRWRIARAANLPSKDAPVALTIAPKIVGNMMKARGAAAAGNKTLNVTLISMPEPSTVHGVEDEPYEIVDVDEEEFL